MDYNKRIFPGINISENTYISQSSTSYLNSNGILNGEELVLELEVELNLILLKVIS